VTAFLPAITPGTVEHWLRNDYYPDGESFLSAIADVLHEEYAAITDAGLLLQLDDPDLVGAENVIAGADCGLGNRVGHPEIVWAKLEDLSEGARIASRALFRDSR
jgi:methionine synthase II (cobalamin-independent)